MLVLFKQCNVLRRKQVTLSISPWREAILLLAIVGSYICVCNAKAAIMQMPEHHLLGAVIPQNLLLWCESKSNPGYMRYSLKTFFCYCWPMHAVPYHHLTPAANSVHSYCCASFKAKILKSPLILCFFLFSYLHEAHPGSYRAHGTIPLKLRSAGVIPVELFQ